MSSLLDQFTILRPYNMFICLCEQNEENPIQVVKMLYNDFKTDPEFSSTYNDVGAYDLVLSNFTDLGLKPNDACIVNIEAVTVGSAGTLITGYLNITHNIIYINSYLLSFASAEDINGKFIIIYAQLK